MQSSAHKRLTPLALALTFMPEPVTTVIGVGLLGYIRYMKQQKEIVWQRLSSAIERSYRINMLDNSTITFQTRPTRQGQLPSSQPPQTSKLYYTPETWTELREDGNRKTKANSLPSSGQQPAGLMGKLESRGSKKFFAPKQTLTP